MIAENLKNIHQRIASACLRVGRNPEEVTLIAVTKTYSEQSIRDVVDVGVFDIGENYVQELRQKHAEVRDDRIRWHFIGHLQSNKIKYIADWIHLIHTVDSLTLGQQISKWAEKIGRTMDILVEVNTTKEESKFGAAIELAPSLVKDLAMLRGLNVKGLMTMGPSLPDPEDSDHHLECCAS